MNGTKPSFNVNYKFTRLQKRSLRDGAEGKTYTVVDELNQDDLTSDYDETLSPRTLIEMTVCILTFVGRGLCLNAIGPTLMDLRQLTNSTVQDSAYIFISQSAGFFGGSVAAKFLLDVCNKEMLMAVVLLVQAFSTVLIPAFHVLWLMCIAFIGQGFSIGVAGIGVCTMCLVLGGKKRSGQFLQAVYLGTSLGSIVGPFVAKPFLSVEAHGQTSDVSGYGQFVLSKNLTNQDYVTAVAQRSTVLWRNTTPESLSAMDDIFSNNTSTLSWNTTTTVSPLTTPLIAPTQAYTKTRVFYVYMIVAIILCIPALGFLTLFFVNRRNQHGYQAEKKVERLTLRNLNASLLVAILLIFLLCFIYFGLQDSYSNLLTTFVVQSNLHLLKATGVYVTSLFWASVCFGRLNGIWIAKFLSPFKMLLCDMTLASVFATLLAIWGDKSEPILWLCSGMIGLSFASVNGATVAWASQHVAGDGYILSVIMVGRCLGLMAMPSGIAGLFQRAGAMSMMYIVFASSVALLLIIITLQIMTRMCGQEGRIVGRNYGELEEELEEMNHDRKE